MTGKSVEERVAVVEATIEDLDRELIRARERLHEIEGDRATIRLLLEQAKHFAEQLSEVKSSMKAVAKETALETVVAMLERRDGVARIRWGLRAQWVAAGIAAGGFVSAILFQVVH